MSSIRPVGLTRSHRGRLKKDRLLGALVLDSIVTGMSVVDGWRALATMTLYGRLTDTSGEVSDTSGTPAELTGHVPFK